VETDEFAERLAVIRKRFASKLTNRIKETDAALPTLAGDTPAVIEAVAITHRCIHELCGIGATVGFNATGQAARTMERILLAATRSNRGLTSDEITSLQAGLVVLRGAAQSDSAAHGIVLA
jgi:hypothetical protein